MKSLYGAAFLFAISLATSAHADFSGKWDGSGDLSGDISLHCRKISLTVSQSETKVAEEEAKATCGFFSQKLDPQTFDIRGKELFMNGEKVGDISDSLVRAKVGDSSGNVVEFNLTLTSDTTLDFVADVERPNGGRFHLTGKLARAN